MARIKRLAPISDLRPGTQARISLAATAAFSETKSGLGLKFPNGLEASFTNLMSRVTVVVYVAAAPISLCLLCLHCGKGGVSVCRLTERTNLLFCMIRAQKAIIH